MTRLALIAVFTPLLQRGDDGPSLMLVIGLALLILILLVVAIILIKYVNLWVQCYFSHADISLFNLVGMSLRKVNPTLIVRAKISAVQAKVPMETGDLEAHFLAGGNVINVARALIAADRAGIDLDFKRTTAIDLAGRDVLEAVRTCVNPKVIDCPDPAKGRKVSAMAKDGIQVLAKARVTVRTNINRLVGGATEETIIARVGEGIVSTIGSSLTHKDVLENPDNISKKVLQSGLDSGTAFEILSIDIADVDIGDNIGAKLQADQAEADKRIAQAKAEERRAMAVAQETEMKATVMENRAKVVLAEAEVPHAMAEAFRSGHLGIMDYMRYRNIESDTTMRRSFGATEGKPGDQGGDRPE
ncbi:MAG: flotillin-like protein FloA [Planctomycetota bacterium]